MNVFSVHHGNGITKCVVNGKDFHRSVHYKCSVWRRDEGPMGTLFFLVGHLIYSLSILHKKHPHH